jgi:hypothetical protein
MNAISDYFLRNCSIAFKCTQQWESLEETTIPTIRQCKDCDREVIRCDTVRQLKNALVMNSCVAISVELFDLKGGLVGVVIPKDKQR